MNEEDDEPKGARIASLEHLAPGLVVFSFPLEGERSFAELSGAEREVATLAIEGRTNAEIAQFRGSRPRTVANQMAKIFQKLGVGSRAELAARFALAVPLRADRDDGASE